MRPLKISMVLAMMVAPTSLALALGLVAGPAATSNLDQIFKEISEARARGARSYQGIVTGVRSVLAQGSGNFTLPTLWINGRSVGPLHGSGPAQARALTEFFAAQPTPVEPRSVKLTGHFTESGFYIDALEIADDTSNLDEIFKSIAQASRSGQSYYEGLITGVRSIHVEERGSGSLPELWVNGRRLGTLHGNGPDNARALEEYFKVTHGEPANVEIRAHFSSGGFYVDALEIKE